MFEEEEYNMSKVQLVSFYFGHLDNTIEASYDTQILQNYRSSKSIKNLINPKKEMHRASRSMCESFSKVKKFIAAFDYTQNIFHFDQSMWMTCKLIHLKFEYSINQQEVWRGRRNASRVK